MVGVKRIWLAVAVLIFGILGVSTLFYLPSDINISGNTPLPATLRVGVLPDESPERLRQRYEPLLDHLSEQLQIACELIIPSSYSELLSLFTERSIDLAYFGGFTYVKARQQAGAIPLVMRRIDTRFTSYFLVAGDSAVESLHDLRGKTIGFGSKLSTSGHLMPRFFLEQQDIVPESFFDGIEYSGAHDKTAYWVRDRRVDVGAANAATIRSMLADGRINEDDLRILWETPPYADYVWAIRPEFDDASRTGLRDAFLQLTPEIDQHAAILAEVNAKGFVSADPDYFANLEQIAIETEKLFATGRVQ
ncbi:MAG: phosphate/phosphite/phosphonate ABC transporter substrate-binding protein [Gammaproteobacteria bacterium]|nr:phosphate/phosphite/phosphonate ABC transporter substrate-binding protein [Gammaproteobacteria bacterium]